LEDYGLPVSNVLIENIDSLDKKTAAQKVMKITSETEEKGKLETEEKGRWNKEGRESC
jgi:hypothetical protein